MRSYSFVLVTIAATLVLAGNVSADMSYTITDLGVLPDTVRSTAAAINADGQVVGWSTTSDGTERAYIWQNGTMTALGTLPGRRKSRAYAINDHGQIVGESYETANSDQHAVLYDPTGGGQNTDLGTLGGAKSVAFDINNSGQIVGKAKAGGGSFIATSFDPTGNQNNVAIGPAGSNATGINDFGVAGGSALMAGGYHPTIFDMTGGTNYIDLGTYGGHQNSGRAINDLGQVVGEAQAPSQPIVAALFDTTGIVTFGTLGGAESMAGGINNLGQVVGWAHTVTGESHATLFDTTGLGNNIDLNTMIDPSLNWTLQGVWGINDSGWIVGSGVNSQGQEHAFLLTPVPVPGAVILGSIGLAFAGWLGKRKKCMA